METKARHALAQERPSTIGTSSAGRRSGAERFARLLDRVIFYSLLALIPLVAIPYGTVEPWWEALFEAVVFALGTLWIVEGFFSNRWLVREHRLFVPLIFLALFVFFQTLPLWGARTTMTGLNVWGAISADPYQTRISLLKLLALTLIGVLLLRYTSSKSRLRALIYTVIGVGIVSAFFGILRQTTQRSEGFLLAFLSPDEGYAQFINYNHFAFLMEMVLGLILGLIVGRGVRRDRVLIYLALAFPVWTALMLCNSRGGLFSMLVQVLFLALFFNLGRSTRESLERERGESNLLWKISRAAIFRPILIALLIVMAFIGALWMGGERLTSHLEAIPDEVAAAKSSEEHLGVRRLDIWRATWQMIKEHPLAGVGFGGYWVAIPQYHNASGELIPQEAHNDYLELLASGGIIGVALAGWFLFLLIKGVRRSLKSKDSFRRAASLGASVGIIGVAVHSVVDFGLHITINALVFTALVVIAVADHRVEGEQTDSPRKRKSQQAAL